MTVYLQMRWSDEAEWRDVLPATPDMEDQVLLDAEYLWQGSVVRKQWPSLRAEFRLGGGGHSCLSPKNLCP